MLDDLRIRRAAAHDDRRLATIAYDSWSPDVSPTPLWDAARPYFRDDAGITVANTLVAFTAESVVGFVAVAPFPYGRGRWAIRALAVDPLFRRRGIGTSLVRAASDASAVAGADRLTAEVQRTNEAATTLLARLGFVEVAGQDDAGDTGVLTLAQALARHARRPGGAA